MKACEISLCNYYNIDEIISQKYKIVTIKTYINIHFIRPFFNSFNLLNLFFSNKNLLFIVNNILLTLSDSSISGKNTFISPIILFINLGLPV